MNSRRKAPDAGKLARVVDALYAAALEPAGWREALADVAALLGGNGGIILSPGRPPDAGGLWVGVEVAETSIPRYVAHCHAADLWFTGALGREDAPSGAAFHSQDLVEQPLFDRSEWWNDFLREMDFYHICGSIPLSGRTGVPETHVSIFRGHRLPDFDEQDLRLHDALLPHLRRALEIHWRLRRHDVGGQGAIQALDRVRIAAFLIDHTGKVAHANRAARAVLGANDGVALRSGRLAVGAAGDGLDAPLAAALAGARRRRERAASSAIAIPRRSGKPAYVATVVPAAEGDPLAAGPGVVAIVFVADPAARPLLLTETVARLLGISPAEARLVNLLLDKDSLQHAAAVLGISHHTARSQMKNVLAKTGTRRQSLVAMLMQASAQLLDE